MKSLKIKYILILICVFMAVSTNAYTELKIDSVYPSLGKMGENLNVNLTGSGFDANTRVSMYVDSGNKKKIIGSVDTPGNAYGVTVSGNTAYVADGSSGLQVIDISNPAKPTIIGSVDTPGNAYGVTVSGNTAYVADGYSGLQVIDISNPTKPIIIGSCNISGYINLYNCVANSSTVYGNIAFVANGYCGLQLIDISNPSKPVIIGSVDTIESVKGVTIYGNMAYV